MAGFLALLGISWMASLYAIASGRGFRVGLALAYLFAATVLLTVLSPVGNLIAGLYFPPGIWIAFLLSALAIARMRTLPHQVAVAIAGVALLATSLAQLSIRSEGRYGPVGFARRYSRPITPDHNLRLVTQAAKRMPPTTVPQGYFDDLTRPYPFYWRARYGYFEPERHSALTGLGRRAERTYRLWTPGGRLPEALANARIEQVSRTER